MSLSVYGQIPDNAEVARIGAAHRVFDLTRHPWRVAARLLCSNLPNRAPELDGFRRGVSLPSAILRIANIKVAGCDQ